MLKRILSFILRIIFLIIASVFLYFGLLVSITLQNLGGYIAILIGVFLLLISIFFKRILKWINNTIIGKVIFVVVLLGAIFFIVVESLIVFSETKTYEGKADAVIILGAGLMGNDVSLNLKYRLDAALEYLNEYPNTLVVVSGGQGSNELRTEAEAMKEYLVIHGINEDNIIEEREATNTRENFKFSKKILDENFLNNNYTVIYVTSNFHVFRSGQIAKEEELTAYGIAAKDVSYLSLTNHLREFISVVNMWTGVFK